MDANSIWVYVFVASSFFVSCTGFSIKMKISASTAKRNEDVTLTCTLQNIQHSFRYKYIYVKNRRSELARFYQKTSGCDRYIYDDRLPNSVTGICGSGTNSSESSFIEYITVLKPKTIWTYYYCKTTYRGVTYRSNVVTLSLLSKAECASLTTPEDVEVLTVTEGKDKTFTCRIGGASPEPEVKLRLNGTSTTDPSVRKVSTSVASQSGETLCRPRKYDRYSPLTTTQFGYSPDRRHDGKFVYCSARNSKIGINDEVTSNKIRLIVQYGPIGKDIAFKPDGAFYTVQESELVTVTCFTDCNPSCTYAWAYQDNVIVYGSRLFLPAATRLEAGYYKCTARNPGNGVTAERFLKLRVQYGSLSTGAAIGIGLAAGVVVASVVAVLICCVVRRKTQRRNRKRSDSEKHTPIIN